MGQCVTLPERAPGQRATALGARAASLDALGVFLRTGGEGKMIHETKRRGPAAVAGASPGAARASIDRSDGGKLCGATRKASVPGPQRSQRRLIRLAQGAKGLPRGHPQPSIARRRAY